MKSRNCAAICKIKLLLQIFHLFLDVKGKLARSSLNKIFQDGYHLYMDHTLYSPHILTTYIGCSNQSGVGSNSICVEFILTHPNFFCQLKVILKFITELTNCSVSVWVQATMMGPYSTVWFRISSFRVGIPPEQEQAASPSTVARLRSGCPLYFLTIIETHKPRHLLRKQAFFQAVDPNLTHISIDSFLQNL